VLSGQECLFRRFRHVLRSLTDRGKDEGRGDPTERCVQGKGTFCAVLSCLWVGTSFFGEGFRNLIGRFRGAKTGVSATRQISHFPHPVQDRSADTVMGERRKLNASSGIEAPMCFKKSFESAGNQVFERAGQVKLSPDLLRQSSNERIVLL